MIGALGVESAFFTISESGREIELTAAGIDAYARREVGMDVEISDTALGYMDVVISSDVVETATLNLRAAPEEFRQRFEAVIGGGGVVPHGISVGVGEEAPIETVLGRDQVEANGRWHAITGYTFLSDRLFDQEVALGALGFWADADATDRTRSPRSLAVVVEGHGGEVPASATGAHEAAGHAALAIRGEPSLHRMPGVDAHTSRVEDEAVQNAHE